MDHNMNTRLAILPEELRGVIFDKIPKNDLQSLRETSKDYLRLVDEHKGNDENIINLNEHVSRWRLDYFVNNVIPILALNERMYINIMRKLLLCMINAGNHGNFSHVFNILVINGNLIDALDFSKQVIPELTCRYFIGKIIHSAVKNVIIRADCERLEILSIIFNISMLDDENIFRVAIVINQVINKIFDSEFYNPENLKNVFAQYRVCLQNFKQTDDSTPIEDVIFGFILDSSIHINNTEILDMLHELKIRWNFLWAHEVWLEHILGLIDDGRIDIDSFKKTFRWLQKEGYLGHVKPNNLWTVVFNSAIHHCIAIYRFFKEELNIMFETDTFSELLEYLDDIEYSQEVMVLNRRALQWLLDNGCPFTLLDIERFNAF